MVFDPLHIAPVAAGRAIVPADRQLHDGGPLPVHLEFAPADDVHLISIVFPGFADHVAGALDDIAHRLDVDIGCDPADMRHRLGDLIPFSGYQRSALKRYPSALRLRGASIAAVHGPAAHAE